MSRNNIVNCDGLTENMGVVKNQNIQKTHLHNPQCNKLGLKQKNYELLVEFQFKSHLSHSGTLRSFDRLRGVAVGLPNTNLR